MGRDSAIFLESIPVCILVGTVLGFLSGMGIGGGSLLILWLTGVLAMEQRAAQGINLLFFLPAAIAAIFFHGRQGKVNWKAALPAIAVGVAAAGLCAWLATSLDAHGLKKYFGVLLILIGLLEIFRKERRKAC